MTDVLTVYAVDDDEAVLLSVQAILEQNNYRAECFSSALEFLERSQLDRPGCVITDLKMPDITGLELQQRLLAAESMLSVVVVTGVADVPTAVALMENGAITLLQKPYSHIDLVQAVRRALVSSQTRWEQFCNRNQVLGRLATLTEDERNVMEFMLAGEPNNTIAHRLDLSMRTVDRRRQAVLEKMNVKSVPVLALLVGTARLPNSCRSGPVDAEL